MAKFKGCFLEVQLEAQSPMIHFQADQRHPGVTLRASEVKPKLDRFLLRKLKKADGCTDEKQLQKKYASFFISPEHRAFNYKMDIVVNSQSVLVDLSPKDKTCKYELYYGNMGENQDGKKMGVFSSPKIVIFCAVAELKKLIQAHLTEFFLVTNFGTMQNKGFGSFLPRDSKYQNPLNETQKEEIAGLLLEDLIDSIDGGKINRKTCYAMNFDEVPPGSYIEKNKYCIGLFKKIKQFYGIMKSGQNYSGFARSYIYEYMHTKNIDNEKAWMKQNGISPVVYKNGYPNAKEDRQDKNPKYVRAMLGTGEIISYEKQEGKPYDKNEKVPVTISADEASGDEAIKRVPSPIFFKIIKNVVFIVAREIPKEIFHKKFVFENKLWDKKGTLFTPDQFDIEEFLEKYVEYYNGDLRNKVNNMGKKVVKVKCIDMSELQ
ncbi:MAG: hypothetical protein K2N87_19585 [Eubacterium sp.]|nr:hypothetical protein [Eubacterium sp.]